MHGRAWPALKKDRGGFYMKRRRFLKTVLAATGLAAADEVLEITRRLGDGRSARVCAAEDATAASGKPVKIVLIGHKPDHPPGTHLYLDECRLLAKCLEQTPGVSAVVSDGWPQDAAIVQDVSAIALYTSPGAEILFKGAQADRVGELLRQGVGLAALHWATGIGDANNEALRERYLQSLGGIFGFGWSGLDISDSRVAQTDRQHPVCRGWPDFDLKDEWYLDLKFLPSARPLAKVRVKDKDQIVAWAYQRPDSAGGRSYGNTLGHFHENFLLEPFRRAIVNGILWTARCEIPEGGAPCALPTS